MMVNLEKEPIMNVQWVSAGILKANAYNPNAVLMPELRLLEANILRHGYVQPILANPHQMIIDGFHRWRLAQESKPLLERYGGMIPVAYLPLSDPEAMMLTIRMNRAKGSHVAYRMSEIVRSLIDAHCLDPAQVAAGIGATKDEIELLHQTGVFEAKGIDGYRYSKAWIPVEVPAGK